MIKCNQMNLISQLSQRYKQFGDRSRKSIINIILAFGAKGITILTQLLIVPLTINYVNPTQYGIWLTLSSIIAWIGFFDLGFGNGMRNKFAEAKAKGNTVLARQYVSTTYFAIGAIILCLLIVVQVLNLFLSWPSILRVDPVYTKELRDVFAIITLFFCFNMVFKLFKSLLTADQKPGVVSWIDVAGQLLSLLAIFLLTKLSDGSLLKLAVFYSGIPTITIIIVSAYAYRFTSYKQYAPHFRFVKKSLIKDILNIGVQFFIIYLCMLVIFQIINVVISRELGPDAVTEYNIAYKYFNIAYSVMTIILTPFWTAFTDAYHKADFSWMRKTKKALEIIWLLEIAAVVLMVLVSPWFYSMWVGDSVSIELMLSIGMAFFILVQSIGAVYMNLINGIGTIRIQLIVYVVFAVIALPLMQYSCRAFGLIGILIAPSLAYIGLALLGKIQIEKILNRTNFGIWNK